MADLRKAAAQDARKYGLNPSTFTRQIGAESGFNPNARSPVGARGVAQIMPGTAAGWGVNPDDPFAALDAAAKHMAQYVKHYGSYRAALVAYNAGPGAVGKPLPAETVKYINKILGGSKGPTAVAGHAGTPAATGSSYLPATSKTDEASAAIDALLAHAASPGSSLLQGFVRNLGSGLYTTKTPTVKASYSLPPQASDGIGPAVPHGKLPKGVANFEGTKVAAWIKPWLVKARQQGWKGAVGSGYRSFADQTRIYNSGVRPAAKPGTSNHEGADFPRGAVDVDRQSAPQLAAILKRLGAPLVWAGAKDPVHFSHPHNGSY